MIRKTLGRKLTTAVGIAVLLIISVFAYVNNHSQSTSLLAEVERHAIQVSQTVAQASHTDRLEDKAGHQRLSASGFDVARVTAMIARPIWIGHSIGPDVSS